MNSTLTDLQATASTPAPSTAFSTAPMTESSTAPMTESSAAVVASYISHADAEQAVRRLAAGGVDVKTISIVGRKYESTEDVQGFYHPADFALRGAGQGAWFGGLFGMMLGAFGFFIFPVVGGLMMIGPLAGFVAGAIGGAGIGALVEGLTASGIPKDQAIKYRERLQAGEFLVVVHAGTGQTDLAHRILEGTNHSHLQTHFHSA